MNSEQRDEALTRRSSAAHGHCAALADAFDNAQLEVIEKVIALGALCSVGLEIKLSPRPKRGGFGGCVEVCGLVEHAVIVVSHECPRALFSHEIDAFKRIRAIAHGVAQADDAGDAALFNVGEHRAQSAGVGVDVADEGSGQSENSDQNPNLWMRGKRV